MTDPLTRKTLQEATLPTVRGAKVQLVPIQHDDYDLLYRVELSEWLGLTGWRHGGLTPDPMTFIRSIHQNAPVQFIVRSTDGRNDPLGLVYAYNWAERHRRTHVALASFQPRGAFSPMTLAGFALFVDYLAHILDWRKLCAESAEMNYEQFVSGAGSIFAVEGCRREHVYVDGRYQHLYDLALFREQWEALKQRPITQRLLGRPVQRQGNGDERVAVCHEDDPHLTRAHARI